MKTNFSTLTILLAFGLIYISASAQNSLLPYLTNDEANSGHYFYPNQGQVVDYSGSLHPEVLFHTEIRILQWIT